MKEESPKRILYLDLLRFLAIIMMIQGHTIESLLAEDYRNGDSLIYSIWFFLRGFTGPLFMFTAGVVFNYLLLQKRFSFKDNPRIVKGIKRGISLIIVGYLLRYPTFKIFDFSDVTQKQWLTFFSVDALHIIGLGLLLLIFISSISSTLRINNSLFFILFTILVLVITPWVLEINWVLKIPIVFAAYFTKEYGSIFPIFPYMQYVFLGAAVGAIISQHNNRNINTVFSYGSGILGIILIIFSRVIFYILPISEADSYSYSLLMIGLLLFLNGFVSLVSQKIKFVSNSILSLARNSIWIYIIHIIILYGSPWSLGLSHLIGRSFSLLFSILSALIMIFLMILISFRIDKFKVKMIHNNLRS